MNASWHRQHPMPMGSTLDQRVEWHVAHAAACGCRDMPPTVLKELRRRAGAAPSSALGDKSHEPRDDALRAGLGKAYPAWTELIARVNERIGPLTEVWAFTTTASGWGLRLVHGKRVILYMTPQRGRFLVSLALGEKAVAATQEVRLPAPLAAAIASAPRYAEGRGVRVTVTNMRQVPGLVTLAEIKRRH